MKLGVMVLSLDRDPNAGVGAPNVRIDVSIQ